MDRRAATQPVGAICQWRRRRNVCNAIRRGPTVEAFWKAYRIGREENAETGPELRKKGLIDVVEGSTDGADSDAVERRTFSAPGACAFCKAPHSDIEVLERKLDLSPISKRIRRKAHTRLGEN
ncbi:hypothetical protein J3458_020283 [Metarhizium acridum]|uniref:uncharacterized protein n=1 Tax=Metarhizium acridum TaxID=92637 RepID=UPI001C6B5C73|nr:hypothetical protein J3458_020283 [Metarhizium acridum]